MNNNNNEVSNVIWLHLKYPNKTWAVHYLARKVASYLIKHEEMPVTIVAMLPEQFIQEPQFFLEVNRQVEEMYEEYED